MPATLPAAVGAAPTVELGERALAIDLLVAAQAEDLRAARPLGSGTARVLALVRERIPFMGEQDPVPTDLEPLRQLVRSSALGEIG
jgi:histidine ammonia-lyase